MGNDIYLLFSFVSALLSKHPSTWIGTTRYEGFLTVAIYVTSFYFTAKFAKPAKWMMYAFGGAVTLFGVISVIQLAGVPFLYDSRMTYYSGGIINAADYMIGTIGNVDFAAEHRLKRHFLKARDGVTSLKRIQTTTLLRITATLKVPHRLLTPSPTLQRDSITMTP